MKNIIWIIILAGILLCWGLFLPYVKSWEVGALELFAKNHLLYGLDLTKGIPVFNLIDGKPNYYCAHPPLIPLLLSLSFRLFGINECSARLVSIIFSIIGLLCFYLLIKCLSNEQVALFSSIFMCFIPMFSYYGRVVNYESVTLGLCLVFLYGFIRYIHTKQNIFLAITIISIILGALSDWSFYLIFPALFIYVKSKDKNIVLFVGFALFAFLIGAVLILIFGCFFSPSIKTLLFPFLHRCQHKELLFNLRFYQILMGRLMTNFTPLVGMFFLFRWSAILVMLFPLMYISYIFSTLLFSFGFNSSRPFL